MAARARAAEARLSDALHARLTERFVNRRTSVLMKKLGSDAALLPVTIADDTVEVDGEHIGQLAGFRFRVDPGARLADRKLLLAAAERHLPALLAERAERLIDAIAEGSAPLAVTGTAITWDGDPVARLAAGRSILAPRLHADPALDGLPPTRRQPLMTALEGWIAQELHPLQPLARLEAAATDPAAGPELRALLIRLVEAGGLLDRAESTLDRLDPAQRAMLRKLGVRVGALDLFVPAMLKPAALGAWSTAHAVRGGNMIPHPPGMPVVLPLSGKTAPPPGYRALGKQALRIDLAEKLLHAAHGLRTSAGKAPFVIDPAMAVSMGLATAAYAQLLRLAGFQPVMPRPLPKGAFGPSAPLKWRWRPSRRQVKAQQPAPPPATGAFAALAELVR